MAKHRCHSIEFKRQVAQEYLAGDTLHGLAKRHDISRKLIRVWVDPVHPKGRSPPGGQTSTPIDTQHAPGCARSRSWKPSARSYLQPGADKSGSR
jgi:transposase-like protein